MTDLQTAIALIRRCSENEVGDPVLAERVRVVRQLDAAALRLDMAQRTLAAARDAGVSAEGQAHLQTCVDETTAEVERLGNRLLQLAVSPAVLAHVN
jgi:hypothetical protein